jgi:prepilin signal peptidase PulO-like enzyme (type II secretory pathway)
LIALESPWATSWSCVLLTPRSWPEVSTAAAHGDDVQGSESMVLVRRVPMPVTIALAVPAMSDAVIATSDGAAALRIVAMAIMRVAAAEDLRTRRLRNTFVGPALVFTVSADPVLSTVAAVAIGAARLLAMEFSKPDSVGMGDVKFAAPAGALVGLQLLGSLLVTIALIGGVLALVVYFVTGAR